MKWALQLQGSSRVHLRHQSPTLSHSSQSRCSAELAFCCLCPYWFWTSTSPANGSKSFAWNEKPAGFLIPAGCFVIDFDQSDDWSRVLSLFYDQNRFSGDPDRGDVGVWAPLACADDWTCDSQSVVDFAKWRQIRDRLDADTRRLTEDRTRTVGPPAVIPFAPSAVPTNSLQSRRLGGKAGGSARPLRGNPPAGQIGLKAKGKWPTLASQIKGRLKPTLDCGRYCHHGVKDADIGRKLQGMAEVIQ
jgi:hypothetical protein